MSGIAQDADSLAALARDAIADGTEEAALPLLLDAAAKAGDDARLWQWTGLLSRALDRHREALDAFGRAAEIAPADALIAHGHARIALEAGLDARPLFDAAVRIEPSGPALLGRAAARFAMGEGGLARDELTAILAANPGWGEGHAQWAQLASMTGRPGDATFTIDLALEGNGADPTLWTTAIDILMRADRPAEAAAKADEAARATGNAAPFQMTRAAALSDSGQIEAAEAAFAALGEPADVHQAIRLARQLVRQGDQPRLLALVDRWMQGDTGHLFWPYASIAWRCADDPRWAWLEGDERLVRVIDLVPDLPPLDRLAGKLRDIHRRSGRFLDQSVRGGTQTDGPLFARIDPDIQALRAAIVTAVEQYRAQLPPIDPAHPMLRHRRDRPVRFAGSWSVRLSGAGYHDNHVHPQGWISSALYIAVPDHLEAEQGWLILGTPQGGLGSALAPLRRIEPRPGRLVLFPSMMWHGTNPFTAGERISVAFDVAPPR